jgi:hypothetical protein
VSASNTGGWVRRVGAAGGGRAYRRRRPVNFYGTIGIVVVLGFGSVAWARHDYQQAPPTLPTPFVVALGVDACGTQFPALEPNPISAPTGYQLLADNVIEVAPTTFTEAGQPNLLSTFVASYTGLTLTKDELVVPVGTKGHKATHKNGTVCPKGTKDAGKVGHVEIATWTNIVSGPKLVTTDAAKVTLSSGLLVTIGFVPNGTSLQRPRPQFVSAMETQKNSIAGTGTVSTSTVPVTVKTPPTTTKTTTTTVKKTTKKG